MSDKKDRARIHDALKALGWTDSQILKLFMYVDTGNVDFLKELEKLFQK